MATPPDPSIDRDPAADPRAASGDHHRAGLFYLFVLYTVWSTTYLAIRIAVTPGSGFPPFTMSGLRLLLAGVLLGVLARLGRRSLRVTRRDAATVVASGLLLWIGGNGMVTWAEQYASSGYAALLIGAMPIWTSVMEAILDRRWPSPLLAASLVVGFAGVAVLTIPEVRDATPSALWAVGALLVAPISWGAGAVLQARRGLATSPLVSATWQQIAGAAGFLLLAALAAEPAPAPSSAAVGAWLYLAVVGGLAFYAFVQAMQILPTRVVMTYAYVNPVGAAILGWLVLDEPIRWWTVLGAGLVIAGVAGVFHERFRA